MDDLGLIRDLAVAVLTAFVGGMVAQRLRQPVIVGYLVAGVVVGPFTPGPRVDPHTIDVLAEIGVAFLMFAVGTELPLQELRRLGRLASIGGTLQIVATMAIGPLLAGPLGLSPFQGIFLGALLALSSTVVALKVLMARGELQALHGRVALGILVAQDVAVVPMVVVLPALAGGGEGLPAQLGIAALKAGGILLGAFVILGRGVPWLLGHAALARVRELFLLLVVGLALGTALVTQAAGLSLAFGAFLAGLAVAESDYRTQVESEILPLRDLFASLFFVSVGMLVNPGALVANAGAVALVSLVTVIGKLAIVVVVVRLLGMPGPVALLAGLHLAQVGEFSFVLARIGVGSGAVPPGVFDLILATAVVTIVATPALVRSGPLLLKGLRSLPLVRAAFAPPVEGDAAAQAMRGHTVICGYGRIGRELAAALDARGLRYAVVDYNPLVVRPLRARGVPAVYGDAASAAVLEHAGLGNAHLLAALVPDAMVNEAATRHARSDYPRLRIVARAPDVHDVERLRAAGASAVVQPELEAGVEVVRHVLHTYGVPSQELAYVVAGRRRTIYEASPDT